MFSLVEGALFVALVLTTACLLPMYLRLKRLDRYQAQFEAMIASSSHTLTEAGNAVRGFAVDGRSILECLSREIDLADAALRRLKAERVAASAAMPNAGLETDAA